MTRKIISVKDGYLQAGYQYVHVDDCWMERKRDRNNRLVPDRQRFPSGMAALADYVSLLFGQVQTSFVEKIEISLRKRIRFFKNESKRIKLISVYTLLLLR